MPSISGIHIFTDRKAKILNTIKASLRDAASATDDVLKEGVSASEQIKEGAFSREHSLLRDAAGDALYQDTAIVLSDDYLSLIHEDKELCDIENTAAKYSELFEKPVFYTYIADDELIVFGACDRGKPVTRRIAGFCEDELCEENINMDYLYFIFNSHNLCDLNKEKDISDIIYAIEEDYGILAELSPLSLPFFDDKFKVLEKSSSFSVYSAI